MKNKLTIAGLLTLYIMLILTIFFVHISTATYIEESPKTITKEDLINKEPKILNNLSLKEDIKVKIKSLNLQHPNIVLAQILLETGNFTSHIFLNNCNIVGMRLPTTRVTTAIGSSNGYSTYNSWEESLIDYSIYQTTYLRNKTEEEYFKYLSDNYAQDTKYVEKLKQIIKTL